jgi:Protein tyrosine and serine/threonine kinase
MLSLSHPHVVKALQCSVFGPKRAGLLGSSPAVYSPSTTAASPDQQSQGKAGWCAARGGGALSIDILPDTFMRPDLAQPSQPPPLKQQAHQQHQQQHQQHQQQAQQQAQQCRQEGAGIIAVEEAAEPEAPGTREMSAEHAFMRPSLMPTAATASSPSTPSVAQQHAGLQQANTLIKHDHTSVSAGASASATASANTDASAAGVAKSVGHRGSKRSSTTHSSARVQQAAASCAAVAQGSSERGSCEQRVAAEEQLHVWIVLELCEGGTLKDAVACGRLGVGSAFDLSKLVTRLLEAAQGMIYLHERGVVHGDLKAGGCW